MTLPTIATLKSAKLKSGQAVDKFLADDDGGELLEYALIAGLIVIAAIAAIKLFSGALSSKFKDMKTEVDNAK